ncbi:MAG: ankyrin repeat domain-containing protein [Thermoleophilia bacterium]
MPDADLAAAARAAREGDPDALDAVLARRPDLATARPDGARTLLHMAVDWPGHRAGIARTVAALAAAGADLDAPYAGPEHRERPLHWAASNDDVAAIDALLDAGARVDPPGSPFGDGTPLLDACAFAQWRAARRLVERGAAVDLWTGAALGMDSRVAQLLAAAPTPSHDEVTAALWAAAHGGHRAAAELLLDRDADPAWTGYDDLTPAEAAARQGHDALAAWLGGRARRAPG